LTSFSLIQRVEQTRSAVLRRGNLRETARESRDAIKKATGEIAKELGQTISRLQEQLEKQKEEIMNVKASSAERELQSGMLLETGRGAKRAAPKRKKAIPKQPKKRRKSRQC